MSSETKFETSLNSEIPFSKDIGTVTPPNQFQKRYLLLSLI
jgi:hypothetical protein